MKDLSLEGALGAVVGAAKGAAVAGEINLAATQYLDDAAKMALTSAHKKDWLQGNEER